MAAQAPDGALGEIEDAIQQLPTTTRKAPSA
jgi:hypothetical protein